MPSEGRWILSPVRLPIPPLQPCLAPLRRAMSRQGPEPVAGKATFFHCTAERIGPACRARGPVRVANGLQCRSAPLCRFGSLGLGERFRPAVRSLHNFGPVTARTGWSRSRFSACPATRRCVEISDRVRQIAPASQGSAAGTTRAGQCLGSAALQGRDLRIALGAWRGGASIAPGVAWPSGRPPCFRRGRGGPGKVLRYRHLRSRHSLPRGCCGQSTIAGLSSSPSTDAG